MIAKKNLWTISLVIAGSLGGLIFILDSVLPIFQRVSPVDPQTSSLSNAKKIALACKLYAGDHDGEFPPSLEVLVPQYLADAKYFISPLNPQEPMGYTYYAGYKDSDRNDIILIEDKFPPSGRRIQVQIDQSSRVRRLAN